MSDYHDKLLAACVRVGGICLGDEDLWELSPCGEWLHGQNGSRVHVPTGARREASPPASAVGDGYAFRAHHLGRTWGRHAD